MHFWGHGLTVQSILGKKLVEISYLDDHGPSFSARSVVWGSDDQLFSGGMAWTPAR